MTRSPFGTSHRSATPTEQVQGRSCTLRTEAGGLGLGGLHCAGQRCAPRDKTKVLGSTQFFEDLNLLFNLHCVAKAFQQTKSGTTRKSKWRQSAAPRRLSLV